MKKNSNVGSMVMVILSALFLAVRILMPDLLLGIPVVAWINVMTVIAVIALLPNIFCLARKWLAEDRQTAYDPQPPIRRAPKCAVQQPVYQQPVAQPVQQFAQQPVAQQPEQHQPVQQPVAQPVQQPVAQPVQQPVAQPVQQPVVQQQPVAQPVQLTPELFQALQSLLAQQQPAVQQQPAIRPYQRTRRTKADDPAD